MATRTATAMPDPRAAPGTRQVFAPVGSARQPAIAG